MRGLLVSDGVSRVFVVAGVSARAQVPGSLQPTAPPVQPTAAPVQPTAPPVQPTAAPAPAVSDQGISVGLRIGWAFPIGSLEKGDSLRSNFSGMLPVWL